ncbi:hypothetical protein B0H14DRAFT_419144 [Mycena olivaceomarginata]|nr:hypothetical protein B0H14DRAFT_419144 [Mycena olivaceomarginata]
MLFKQLLLLRLEHLLLRPSCGEFGMGIRVRVCAFVALASNGALECRRYEAAHNRRGGIVGRGTGIHGVCSGS